MCLFFFSFKENQAAQWQPGIKLYLLFIIYYFIKKKQLPVEAPYHMMNHHDIRKIQ